MAFRKKVGLLLKYEPDILIIPECEHPDKLKQESRSIKFTNMLWFGKNPNKGLGIFSFNDFILNVSENYNENFKIIVPLEVTKQQFSFNLFAVWANNPEDKDGRYITQVWKAISYYNIILKDSNTILIGDFNSNTIWDKPKREGNHTTVVKLLEEKKVFSTYHLHFKQLQGKEEHPTLYMYRHKEKSYHIDYCFASIDMINHLQNVEIGDYEFWCQYSDHVPLIATFNYPLLTTS
jgi:exodeoxyribonuclease-3